MMNQGRHQLHDFGPSPFYPSNLSGSPQPALVGVRLPGICGNIRRRPASQGTLRGESNG